MIKKLLKLNRIARNSILYGVGFITVVGFSYALWNVYQTAPRFLFTLDEQLLADPAVLKTIGEQTGTAYTYSDHVLVEGDSAAFTCTIIGRCDSSYLKVRGYYYKRNNQISGVVTDTIMKTACL
jgi:hypothetical protein